VGTGGAGVGRGKRFTSYQYYQAEYRVELVPMGDFFQTVIREPE
jgi:hypothetical protein